MQVLEERQNARIAGIVEEVFRRVGQGIMRNALFTAPRYVGVCAWSDEGEHPSTGQQAWVSVWYCVTCMSETLTYDNKLIITIDFHCGCLHFM